MNERSALPSTPRPASAGVLLCALAACLLSCGRDSAEAAPKGKPAGGPSALRVEGYVVRPAAAETEFRATGSVRAAESVELCAETSGRIVSIPARGGKKVSKGALVVKLDDAELQAQLKSARASLDLAKSAHSRAEALHGKGSLTDAELESSAASLRAAEASVELLRAQIAKTEIRAPFDGVLGLVDLSAGARLNAGDRVATLASAQRLEVDFSLPQRHALALKPGSAVRVEDPDRKGSFPAKVRALDAVLAEGSRMRRIRAEVEDRSGKLLAGSFVEVAVPLGSADPARSFPVPAEAFTLDDEGAFLFVARGGKAETRRVKTGLRTPISVEVSEGLSEGDTVVVSGTINLRHGAAVEVVSVRNALRGTEER